MKVNLVGFKSNFQYADLDDQVLAQAREQGYILGDMDIWLSTVQSGPDSGCQSPREELVLYDENLSLYSKNKRTQEWFDTLE